MSSSRPDPLDYKAPRRGGTLQQFNDPKILLLIGVIAAIGFFIYQHDRGGGDQSASIAASIGADSCTQSGYGISTAAAGKVAVYNCDMPSGKTICVTKHKGVVSNSTLLVRLAFADALSGKPICLG